MRSFIFWAATRARAGQVQLDRLREKYPNFFKSTPAFGHFWSDQPAAPRSGKLHSGVEDA